MPEWPQEAQKLESAGLKSHLGIRVHRTRLSVRRPQKAQKRDWARLEPYFVTFVLFVVEPFTPLAGQREHSREKPGERSLAGQVRSLLFHGNARFRILQKAQGFFTWMHRMHRIFSGKGWLVIPGIRKPAPDHRPSRLLMQQPLVLLILCILCIHVHKKSIPPRRCHSIRAAEMGQAEPDIVRAGRPRSRGGLTASSFTGEPFAKFRRQGFYGSGEGTGNSRGRSALCLNDHKRHKSWNRQVSNLI